MYPKVKERYRQEDEEGFWSRWNAPAQIALLNLES